MLRTLLFIFITAAFCACSTSNVVPKPSVIAAKQHVSALIAQLAREILPNKKLVIGVAPFEDSEGKDTELGNYLRNHLEIELLKSPNIRLAERKQLDKIKEEQSLSISGLLSDDTAASIGNMIGAQGIVSGSYRYFDKSIQLTVRLISTTKGEVLKVGETLIECYWLEHQVATECGNNLSRENLNNRANKHHSRCDTTIDGYLTMLTEAKFSDNDRLENLLDTVENADGTISFQDLNQTLGVFTTEQEQLQVLRSVSQLMCKLSTNQAKGVLKSFNNPMNRLTALGLLVKKLSDPQNKSKLIEQFKFHYFREQAKALLD